MGRAPNVTPICVTEQNTIKPVATFSPGSARAKAAALLARARAVKAEETSRVTSESVNVQQLTITKDIDNSLANNDSKLETQKTKAETKAETQKNGSEIQEYDEVDQIEDQANSEKIQNEKAAFIEKNKKNPQKKLEVSISKQIDPYQLKEKLESLENELETHLSETSKPNYKEQENIKKDQIQDENLAIEDSESKINVMLSQERSIESNEHLIEVTMKREGTFTAEDKIIEEPTVTIKREGTFTLDSPTEDGPSPPKIVKPSSKEELISKDLSDTSATGAIPKQVKFDIPSLIPYAPVPKIEVPKSPRKIRIGNTKNVKE